MKFDKNRAHLEGTACVHTRTSAKGPKLDEESYKPKFVLIFALISCGSPIVETIWSIFDERGQNLLLKFEPRFFFFFKIRPISCRPAC